MKKYILLLLALLSMIGMDAKTPFDATSKLPVSFQGRFRTLEPTSELWLYDFYHKPQLAKADLQAFQTSSTSALELLWKMHFLGHTPWIDSPLFWIHYADIKFTLQLPLNEDHFRYSILKEKLQPFADSSNDDIRQLIQATESFAALQDPSVINDELQNTFQSLKKKGKKPLEIAKILESQLSLANRLQNAGSTLKMIPSRLSEGEWFSLHALKVQIYDSQKDELVDIGNFSVFSDTLFFNLRSAYLDMEKAVKDHYSSSSADSTAISEASTRFSNILYKGYSTIAGQPYKKASGKSLTYPSMRQLHAETLYHRIPLVTLAIVFYSIGLLILALNAFQDQRILTKWALAAFLTAFILHSAALALRIFILERPPVSNMFETVLYVPWIAMIIGFIFFWRSKHPLLLAAAGIASVSLLTLLKITYTDARLENVQAVLDSQYWLTIHVLMVVGCYGIFALCGVLGHLYLFACIRSNVRPATLHLLAKSILHTMYIGVALLIPGTILGGVWAAESWGRFWDWDPKESWAFISACVYVLVIHAYTFRYIRDFGLAIGAVFGLLAISFTWYGVNYILGTGMHSYGFGKGGAEYYYLYFVLELLFLAYMVRKQMFPDAIKM